jgi:O-antigen/teichoic acid export membrane protein
MVSAVWAVHFRELATEDAGQARRVALMTLSLSLVGAVGLAAAAPLVVPTLFGSRFTESIGVAAILLVGRVFHDLYAVQSVRMVMQGRRLAMTVLGVASFALVALSAWIGYSVLGVHGAAIGVALAQTCRWAATATALSPRRSS